MKKLIFTLICITNIAFAQEGNQDLEIFLHKKISEIENILNHMEKDDESYNYFLGRLDSYEDICWHLKRVDK